MPSLSESSCHSMPLKDVNDRDSPRSFIDLSLVCPFHMLPFPSSRNQLSHANSVKFLYPLHSNEFNKQLTPGAVYFATKDSFPHLCINYSHFFLFPFNTFSKCSFPCRLDSAINTI